MDVRVTALAQRDIHIVEFRHMVYLTVIYQLISFQEEAHLAI